MPFNRHPLADPTHPGRRQAAPAPPPDPYPDPYPEPDPDPDPVVDSPTADPATPRPATPGTTGDGKSDREQVVLVDASGAPIGIADKRTVHGRRTPRHLAFSCYAFDDSGRLLVTQRAEDKLTFPGVWTNTCCGHPAPGEGLVEAASRRLRFELGVVATGIRVVLPDFSYRASDGRVEENEFCPVLVCQLHTQPVVRPDEVKATDWWTWDRFMAAAADPASGFAPWARKQAPLLDAVLYPVD